MAECALASRVRTTTNRRFNDGNISVDRHYHLWEQDIPLSGDERKTSNGPKSRYACDQRDAHRWTMHQVLSSPMWHLMLPKRWESQHRHWNKQPILQRLRSTFHRTESISRGEEVFLHLLQLNAE